MRASVPKGINVHPSAATTSTPSLPDSEALVMLVRRLVTQVAVLLSAYAAE